mmetsp:Transcript_15215/g.45594  ORF Transcript_15215/g.45594 Transcript_15215/m.45594 type:complete len:213 (+) Transcript_15215:1688-2326(+)
MLGTPPYIAADRRPRERTRCASASKCGGRLCRKEGSAERKISSRRSGVSVWMKVAGSISTGPVGAEVLAPSPVEAAAARALLSCVSISARTAGEHAFNHAAGRRACDSITPATTLKMTSCRYSGGRALNTSGSMSGGGPSGASSAPVAASAASEEVEADDEVFSAIVSGLELVSAGSELDGDNEDDEDDEVVVEEEEEVTVDGGTDVGARLD